MNNQIIPVNIGIYWSESSKNNQTLLAALIAELSTLSETYANTLLTIQFINSPFSPDEQRKIISKLIKSKANVIINEPLVDNLFDEEETIDKNETVIIAHLDLVISLTNEDVDVLSMVEASFFDIDDAETNIRHNLNNKPKIELIKLTPNSKKYWCSIEAIDKNIVAKDSLTKLKQCELKQLDKYNASLKSWKEKHKKSSYPLMSKNVVEANKLNKNSTLFNTLQQYTIADATAIRMQKRSNLLVMWIATLALLSATIFLINAHLSKDKQVLFMVIYLCSLVIGFASSKLGAVLGLYEKHLQHRCIAELLRIKFFWNINESYQDVKDEFHQHIIFRSYHPLQWLNTVVKNESPSIVHTKQVAKAQQLVIQHWLKDQKTYFTKAIAKNKRYQQRINKISLAALFVAITSSSITISSHLISDLLPQWIISSKQAFIFLAGWLALIVATLEVYKLKMADEDVNQLNKRMLKILTNAESLLQYSQKASTNYVIIKSLLKEAAIENVEWFNLKNVRNIDDTQVGLQRLVIS